MTSARWRIFMISLWTLLLLAVSLSLAIGAYRVRLSAIIGIIAALFWPGSMPSHPAWTNIEQVVIAILRLPRILVAGFAGAGLGLSGTALQAMMRNPLVGPDLVGVSSGAACGGVLAMFLNWSPTAVVATAFCGGLLALAITASLAQRIKSGGALTIVLSGVFIGAFFTAMLGMIEYCADPETQLPGMVYWLLGSFADVDRAKVLVIAIPTVLGGIVLMRLRWQFNLLSLSDLDARRLGVNVSVIRWMTVAIVSFIVAAQVSVSGGIPWMGLLVPHLSRMLVGPDHRRLLPVSAVLGALTMIGVDDAARSIAQQEIPVGLITALIGTPIICILFLRTQAGGWTVE